MVGSDEVVYTGCSTCFLFMKNTSHSRPGAYQITIMLHHSLTAVRTSTRRRCSSGSLSASPPSWSSVQPPGWCRRAAVLVLCSCCHSRRTLACCLMLRSPSQWWCRSRPALHGTAWRTLSGPHQSDVRAPTGTRWHRSVRSPAWTSADCYRCSVPLATRVRRGTAWLV